MGLAGEEIAKLQKMAHDEPVFVLRAKDFTAPMAVQRWINNAMAIGVDPAKINGATQVLAAMQEWQHCNVARRPD